VELVVFCRIQTSCTCALSAGAVGETAGAAWLCGSDYNGIVPIIKFTDNGKIGQVDVITTSQKTNPLVLIGIEGRISDKRCVPHPCALNCHIVQPLVARNYAGDVAGHQVRA
jgi:hypothetical protein